MKIGHRVDSLLYSWTRMPQPGSNRFVATRFGQVRVADAGSGDFTLLSVPDGPCVIEHFAAIHEAFRDRYRIVTMDLPGFGFSRPSREYDHSPEAAVECIHEVVTTLGARRLILSFSCANGYYALAYARKHPEQVSGLILSQTPSVAEMERWVKRIIPRVIQIPVLGQLLTFALRKKIAATWLKNALPKTTPRGPWLNPALRSLEAGGCNCLAGVVQGLAGQRDENFKGVSPSIPVVALWGGSDRSHRPTDPRSILELVPHAEVSVLPELGHFPNLENLEAFRSALARIEALGQSR